MTANFAVGDVKRVSVTKFYSSFTEIYFITERKCKLFSMKFLTLAR